jgi:nitrous oxide reductase accessory protein NosL
LAAAAFLLCVAACGRDDAGMPAPQEITDAAIAEFCGMSLDEHPGP